MSVFISNTGRSIPNNMLANTEIISTYDSYEGAQNALRRLASTDTQIKGLMIVGNGVRTIELVVSKLNYARVAKSALSTGAILGFIAGIIITAQENTRADMLKEIMASVAIGAGLWMLFSMFIYITNKKHRKYLSKTVAIADKYELRAPRELVKQARDALTGATCQKHP